MEQQESINQCLNKCITTVSSLMNEFVVLKERCNEFEVRVGVYKVKVISRLKEMKRMLIRQLKKRLM